MSAPVSDAEHEDRMARVLSVGCPKCGAPPLSRCESPSGKRQDQHAARWDAWYVAYPEASAS